MSSCIRRCKDKTGNGFLSENQLRSMPATKEELSE